MCHRHCCVGRPLASMHGLNLGSCKQLSFNTHRPGVARAWLTQKPSTATSTFWVPDIPCSWCCCQTCDLAKNRNQIFPKESLGLTVCY